jgi:hypothetical protein
MVAIGARSLAVSTYFGEDNDYTHYLSLAKKVLFDEFKSG